MTTTRYTSRVFVAIEALDEVLQGVNWPGATSHGGPAPEVYLGDMPPHEPREAVIIAGRVDEDGSDWATLGRPARDERITLLVRIIVAVPGLTGRQVLARLRELADALQEELRDTTTGQPLPLGYSGEVATLGVTRVDPVVIPEAEGWTGRCDLFIATQARI
jgi:hypothetical protein